jgi:predicted ATPase
MLLIAGTAGVGKSRLTAEFLRGVEARVVIGRCLPYGQGITYWPVVSMVKLLLDSRHGCAGAASVMDRDATVAAAVSALLGEQPAVTSATEIRWAVRKLFESSADRAPLVLVFDDLHWAEPTLLDLIEHIVDFSRRAHPDCLPGPARTARSQPALVHGEAGRRHHVAGAVRARRHRRAYRCGCR